MKIVTTSGTQMKQEQIRQDVSVSRTCFSLHQKVTLYAT